MKKHGHYCKVCGEHKANEKFSGKGHAAHICKQCAALSVEERNQTMTLNRIMNLPMYLSKEQRSWLRKRCGDQRPEIREAAEYAYDIRFPHAKRNEQKKQYHVDHLTLMVNDELFDAYGDELPLNAVFRVRRKEGTISIAQDGQETTVQLPPDRMTQLLKWMVYSLEIFCWQEDYGTRSSMHQLPDEDWLDMLEEDDENEWVELELEDDAEDDLIEFDGAEEADIPVRWQLDITYRNGTSQQVISRAFLPDRVEELVWQLMEYLFPEDEDEPEE